jgi:uncharacterized protein (UPF0332 family)/predicted nucleotidyltransferase
LQLKRLQERQIPYLTEKERATLEEFLARLEAACGDRVWHVIFFGSKARGDYEQWSDVDLLLVADIAPEELDILTDGLETEDGVPFLPLLWSPQEYDKEQRLKMPLYVNMRRDGVDLWDEAGWEAEARANPLDFVEGKARMIDEATRETLKTYLDLAHEGLRDARLLLDNGSYRGCLSRAYYGAFYAATAALYALNVIRSKHSGIRAALSEFLVQPGLVEADYREVFQELFKARNLSDYATQFAPDRSDTARLLGDAERFVARMETFLRERGALDEGG